MRLFKIGNLYVTAIGADRHQGLQEFVAKYDLVADNHSNKLDIQLLADESGLRLTWHRLRHASNSKESLSFYIDVDKAVRQYRSFPAPKQGAFNQALGRKSRRIIDGTGGWGADALLMCAQGYQVTIMERQPIMALLLSDAMTRLSHNDWVLNNNVIVPTVRQADSIDALSDVAELADCVYLDPMFPPKKKQSAATNKKMQLLHYLVGEDLDATELVAAAARAGVPRIAVKRPDYAQPLYGKPAVQFASKLVHYDVYLDN